MATAMTTVWWSLKQTTGQKLKSFAKNMGFLSSRLPRIYKGGTAQAASIMLGGRALTIFASVRNMEINRPFIL